MSHNTKSLQGNATLAQTLTYSVCEAIQRFTEKTQPVVAKFVKNKPSTKVPTVKPQQLTDDLTSTIDQFSQVSSELASVRQDAREKRKQLKGTETRARERLSKELVKQPEGRASVQLARAAPIPSTVRAVRDDKESDEDDDDDDEESNDDDDDDNGSDDDDDDNRGRGDRGRGDRGRDDRGRDDKEESESMLDDEHSVRSASRFVVGQKPVKRIKPDSKPLSQIKMRGIVLGACCKVLREMRVDPNQPARQSVVHGILGNVEFWERVLAIVQANIEHADSQRKVQDLTLFIKEEKKKVRERDEEEASYLLGLIRQASKRAK